MMLISANITAFISPLVIVQSAKTVQGWDVLTRDTSVNHL